MLRHTPIGSTLRLQRYLVDSVATRCTVHLSVQDGNPPDFERLQTDYFTCNIFME